MNTTITIKKEVKAKLDEIGKKSESYNDVIERLCSEYERAERYAIQNYAINMLKEPSLNEYNKKLLKQIADGKSKSWDEVKRELE
jgi:predicted CopG family antitoxin